jgi:hypothetical protein
MLNRSYASDYFVIVYSAGDIERLDHFPKLRGAAVQGIKFTEDRASVFCKGRAPTLSEASVYGNVICIQESDEELRIPYSVLHSH